MTPTNLLVPTFRQMLAALAGWLDKAKQQLPQSDAEALLSARLAPDMFPLSTQIRFACVQAHEAVARLQGQPFPPIVAQLLNEGRGAGNQPGSLSDAQDRIADTRSALDRLSRDALDVGADTAIVHDLPNGMTFDLTADQYSRDWALAQLYFHVMTAYAILRKEGVHLGKADYIPHLLPHLRTSA